MGLFRFFIRKHPQGPPHHDDRPGTAAEPPPPIIDSRKKTRDETASSNGHRRSLLKGSSRPRTKPPKPYFLGIRDEDGSLQPQEHPAVRPRGPDLHDLERRQTRRVKPYNRRRGSRRKSGANSKTPGLALNAQATTDRLGKAGRPGRYVDILDAQSEFKRCDFRSRVLATGARDYGEDVAERNMRHITADLASSATLVNVASTAAAPRVSHRKGAYPSEVGRDSGSSILSVTAFAEPERGLSTLSRRHRRNTSPPLPVYDRLSYQQRKRSPRARSLEPTHLDERFRPDPYPVTPPMQDDWLESDHWPSYDARDLAYKRINTPAQRAGSQRRYHPSQNRWKRNQTYRQASPSRSRSRSASPPPISRYRASSSRPSQTPRTSIPYHHRARSVDDEYYRPRSPCNFPARKKALNFADLVESDLMPEYSPAARRGEMQARRGWLRSGDDRVQGPYAQGKQYSLRPTVPESTEEAMGRRERLRTEPRRRIRDKRASWQVAQDHALRDALAAKLARVRSASDVGPADALTMDIAGHVPDRTSSLKQWSIASLTPTTDRSDRSSVHARPRSIHTANTSVDLPPLISPDLAAEQGESPGTKGSPGRLTNSSFLTDLDDEDSSDTDVASRVESQNGLRLMRGHKTRIGDVSGADWLSADYPEVDSFAEQQLRYLRDDESLLFKPEGVVDANGNLPGLQERPDRSPCLMCSLLERAAPDPSFRSKRPGSWGSRPPCNHRDLTSPRDRLLALGYDYDTESDSDGEVTQRGRPLDHQLNESHAIGGIQRLPFGGRIQEDEEEDEDDKIVTEHKLRREPRTRERRIETRNRSRGFESVREAYEHRLAADE